MYRVTSRDRNIVWGVSIFLAFLIIISSFVMIHMFHRDLMFDFDGFIILGVIVALFPPGVLSFFTMIWRRGINKNVPKLLVEMAEAGKIGMSIPQALKEASERDLGPLTGELKKLVAQVSCGYTFEESFNYLIERMDVPLAKRAFYLIYEVYNTGGNVEEVLDAIKTHLSEAQLTIQERRAIIKPYISTIYIAFLIFLFIDVLLIRGFFRPILAIHSELSQTGDQLFSVNMDLDAISKLLFHMATIQSVIAGLMAGKMGEGSMEAGLKHVIFLLLVDFAAFYYLVW